MRRNSLGRTGLEVSRLGFGASSLGAVFHAVDEDEAMLVIRSAKTATSGIRNSAYSGMSGIRLPNDTMN